MPIKLYKQDFSPLARAAVMVCDIFNVPVEIVEMDLSKGDHYKPEFLKLNPCHSIPVFVDGDLVINESHAILMYVAEVYGNNSPLYPTDVKQRALINTKLFFSDSVLATRAKNITIPGFVDKQKGITEKQIQGLEGAANFLEEYLSRSKFLAMDHITIADIIAYAIVCSYHVIIPMDKYPKINAWLKEMEQQPYCKKHNEKGVKILNGMLRSLIE